MLEFYEFNTLNIIVVLLSTFVIYYILCNYLSTKNKENKESNQFSIEYLIFSVIAAVSISLIVSYILSANEETVLTSGYWDKN